MKCVFMRIAVVSLCCYLRLSQDVEVTLTGSSAHCGCDRFPLVLGSELSSHQTDGASNVERLMNNNKHTECVFVISEMLASFLVPLQSLGSLRNVLVFERKAHLLLLKTTLN